MSIIVSTYRRDGDKFVSVLTDKDAVLELSNANGRDVLDALGIEDICDSWPIACFRAVLTVARRKRLGHRSPEIPVTEDREPGRMLVIDCGRSEGYIERRLEDLSIFVNRAFEAGATHVA
ncbi:hypothetical protein M2322_004713 [Rhodoblastus acidophilus]|uniref:hypothetical protein n=1 Tax=Rhodoblastus acidophilus TaxID=1074 RepID=UPI0022246B57|nr:hypothetical protein [Rhodoblastus acidophilus]MCW2319144.1 hypothetical protein [Rhodoblastus acidophilus]